MAIFGGQPAGIQIKKWLIILVSLIVLINVLAVASLVVLQRSVTAIHARYQPVLISASDISTIDDPSICAPSRLVHLA